jgi:benzodiazapine receptor
MSIVERPMFEPSSIVSLVPFALICFAAAALGSVFTARSVRGWYAGLTRPSWNPPSWVFGTVWTILYLLMAVSAWLVWRHDQFRSQGALILFGVQLALNVLWTYLFFWKRQIGPAFGEIALLWMMLVATIVAFYPLSRLAAWLLVPYAVWVAFASYLNFRIWQLNP